MSLWDSQNSWKRTWKSLFPDVSFGFAFWCWFFFGGGESVMEPSAAVPLGSKSE